MYVVSGCPRSGTSLMMDLMRVAYGEKRLLGKKFPQDEQMEMMKNQSIQQQEQLLHHKSFLHDFSLISLKVFS